MVHSANPAAAPPNDDTSSSLLARVKQHDADAWTKLVTWFGPFLLRWCRSAALQPADCDEVSQEVLTNVWRRLATFRREQPGDSFRGWLYVITKNCIADLRQKRQRQQALDRLAEPRVPAQAEMDLPPEDAAAGRDWKRRALRLLIQDFVARHVNDRGFKAFYRTAVDGQPAVEVAQELGMSA